MNKRHYEHTLPNIRGSLSNTYFEYPFMFFNLFILYSVYLVHDCFVMQLCPLSLLQ